MRTIWIWALLLGSAQAQEDLLKRAIELHQGGKVAESIDFYTKYLEKRPDSPVVLSNLGAAYARLGRFQEAIDQYRKSLKLDPKNPTTELNLALTYYKTGQIDQAATVLEDVHSAAPHQLQPVLLLADCRLALGENKGVIELLDPLAAQRPDDLAIAYMLGTALIRDDQPTRGRRFIDRILRNGDSAEAWLLMGTTKLQAGDYPSALKDLEKAVALNPNLADVQAYYGQALLRTGDPARAIGAFQQALAANPNDFMANLQMAVLLKDDDKLEEALACLKRAMQIRPNDILARYQLATLEIQQGKLNPARIRLETIAEEVPAYIEAHVTLATVYYRLQRKADGDRERAIVQKLNAEKQAKQAEGINVK